jgi:transposase-like protein
MNLADLVEQFGSSDRCRDYLEHLRWPDGVECPKCESKSVSRIKARKQFDCNSCRKRFSVTAGTIFHDSHLPLWKWFAAVYLMCESKKGISALQVKRMLKIGSYETAWYLCHRIRAAMVDEAGELLSGVVEIDETYIGGKMHGRGRRYTGNKTMVMGAVERGGRVRFRAMPKTHLDKRTAREFVEGTVADNAAFIYTDEHSSYPDFTDWNTKHRRVNHSEHEWVNGQVHTNTVESVWSLFDRSVIGSYHKLSKKHLPAYLDEAAFRWNNRENPYLFRDTILRLVETEALPYKELIAAK